VWWLLSSIGAGDAPATAAAPSPLSGAYLPALHKAHGIIQALVLSTPCLSFPLSPRFHPLCPPAPQPDITLWNAAQDISQTLGLKWPRVAPNGDVFWTRNGIYEVACNFKGLEVSPRGSRSPTKEETPRKSPRRR
jgi:hypothetical protein